MVPPDDPTPAPGDDGEDPVVVMIDPIDPGAGGPDPGVVGGGGNGPPRRKIYVDGIGATILKERVEYLDADGHLVTESLKDFTRRALHKRFATLDDFLRRWKDEDRKQAIIDEMAEEGLNLETIRDELGKDLDPFDLVCHVAFDAKPLTRKERANNVRKRDVFGRYGDTARAVLEALLEKYADEGILNLDDTNVLKIDPFSHMGTPLELVRAFGGKPAYKQAVRDLQNALYEESA
jgi:type I restriction enzyme R subunit